MRKSAEPGCGGRCEGWPRREAVRSCRPMCCMAICTAVSSGVCRPPRSSADGAALKSPMMTVGPIMASCRQASMRCSRNVSVASPKGTCTLMTFSCHVGPTSSYAARRPSTPRCWWTCAWTSLLWDMGTPLTHVVRYWCPVLVRMGVRLGWAVWVLSACSCHTMASRSHLAITGTSCRSAALAASYRVPGSLRDMRLTRALVTSWVCALVAPGGPLARRGSSHCPRRILRLIAVATRCSSGIFGSSSHACGTSPFQTVPAGTWLAGVRSCTGHSGICLSSQRLGFFFPLSRPTPEEPAI